MGVCLNQKYITNNLLDNKPSKEHQAQVINLNIDNTAQNKEQNQQDNEKDKNNDNKNEISPDSNQNDIIKSSINNGQIQAINKLKNNNDKIINFQIQSKYRTKFFNNSINNNNLNNNSINNYNESQNTNINNFEKYIFFTNLNEKKEIAASTASASNIKL